MKGYILFLIMALTAYPVMELSRLIVVNALVNRLYPEVHIGLFYFELVYIWVFYLAIVPVYLISTNNRINGREK